MTQYIGAAPYSNLPVMYERMRTSAAIAMKLKPNSNAMCGNDQRDVGTGGDAVIAVVQHHDFPRLHGGEQSCRRSA